MARDAETTLNIMIVSKHNDGSPKIDPCELPHGSVERESGYASIPLPRECPVTHLHRVKADARDFL